jgi:hypothetical protein
MYEGPRRSSSDVAIVETDGTIIAQADRGEPGSYHTISVLPGLRALRVRLLDDHPHSMIRLTIRSSTKPVRVCFVARAGHTYTTRPVYAGATWRPEIIDQNTAERVRTDGFDQANEQCAEQDGGYEQHHRAPIVAPHPPSLKERPAPKTRRWQRRRVRRRCRRLRLGSAEEKPAVGVVSAPRAACQTPTRDRA